MINYLKKLGINAKKNEISISYETWTADRKSTFR